MVSILLTGGMVRKCASCGGENDDDAEHCIFCGKPLIEPGMCPECGTANLPDARLCRICGADLTGMEDSPKAAPSERPGYRLKYEICAKCGHKLGATQIECPACGYGSPYYEAKAGRSAGLPMAAGVLLFIAGMINILWGLLLGERYGHYFEDFEYYTMTLIVIGVISLPAAFLSMMRRLLPLVMAAAVLTLVTIGPWYVCSICGFSAVVMLAISTKEFD
jgi:ribosomal protein L40E